MFTIYVDKEQKIVWLTSFRNGSTTLKHIANLNKNLIPCGLASNDVHNYLRENPDTPIYSIFRDPEVRFRSGLTAIYFEHRKISQSKQSTCYKNILSYIKTVNQLLPFKNIKSKNSINHYAYHLFNPHLEHTLWASMILASYDKNIKLVPMDEYSAHLNLYYAKEYDQMTQTFGESRTNSFNETTNLQNNLWEIYQEVMFENNSSEMFDQWMKVEKQIFETYKNNYKQDNIKDISNELINVVLNDPLYLTDIYSNRVDLINILLNKLHTDSIETNNYPLYEYNQNYLKIKKLAQNFMNNNLK